MYNPSVVVNNFVDADKASTYQIYVQKLRESIDDMAAIKQNAIINEDYNTADQMRLKITALQFQLMKLEDQFNADFLKNVITQWQNELTSTLQSALLNPIALPKQYLGVGILQAPFHLDFLEILKTIPRTYFDSIIRAMLIINPQELPDSPKSPYGWSFVSQKISALSAKPADMVDSAKATVTLVIFDIISVILGLSVTNDLRRETYDLILRHAFNYFHAISVRRLNPETEGRIFEKIFIRLSVIIGDISEVARRDLYRYALGYLDPHKKIAPEEIVMVLSSIRYISAVPQTEDEASGLIQLIRELVNFHDKSRKTSVKVAAVQALERIIQPLDYTRAHADPWHASVSTEIIDVYKRTRKWATSEDERPAALRLLVAVLVNSRFEFFAQNMDAFLTTDLCPKGKIKPYAYDCILQLLRGKYYVDTRLHWRQRAEGVYEFGKSYGSLTRSPEDQSPGGVANRLSVIAELFFFRRKGPITDDLLDICADIVVQITAHNLQIGLKLVSDLMNTNSVDSGPDVFYIGVRALRTIVSPLSGFSTYAYSRIESDFDTLLKEFPYDLEVNFTHILNYIDMQIGLNVLGTAAQPLDTSASGVAIKGVDGNVFSSEALTKDDIIGMLTTTAESAVGTATSSDDLSVISTRPPTRNQVGGLPRTATSRFLREALVSPVASDHGNTTNRRDSTSVLDSYRESYRRDSEIGVNPLIISSFTQDISSKEVNDKVHKTVKEWFVACEANDKMPIKYLVASSLTDGVRVRKRAAVKLRPEQRLALQLLKEVIRVLPFVPAAEFIGGSLFMGAYLIHSLEEVGAEIAVSLSNVFETYPQLRIVILNGFINFVKSTPFRDDISLCTIVTFMSQLTKLWATDSDLVAVDQDAFFRVSCKMDALMLICMARPVAKIRKLSVQILLDMYTIQQGFDSFQNTLREMPLAAILIQMEDAICRQAMYGFLEKGLFGHLLSPRLASSMRSLSFLDVASSDYANLFRFYLGELAHRFSTHGRTKAVRRCAKFLRIFAIPMISAHPGNAPENLSAFTAHMVLTMALAGVPLISEIDYSLNPQNSSTNLLFEDLRVLLPRVIANENFVETKPVFESFYFLHRGVVQLLMMELAQIYNEIRVNSAKSMGKCYIDNIIYGLRRISQSSQFESIVEDEPLFPSSVMDLYAEFLALAGVPLGDVSFLTSGPVWRLKTAVNYCVIVQRFSEAIGSIKRSIQRRALVSQDPSELEVFERIMWAANDRQNALAYMREWYELIFEITPSMPSSFDTRKSDALRKKLLIRASIAAEKIMSLGNVFPERSLPSYMLAWLTLLETNGYRVLSPQFLYSHDEALGTALANSYSATGVHPQVFYQAIFEQVLPRLDESPVHFIQGSNRRMSYAEDYFAGMHSLPPKVSEHDTYAVVYPELSREEALKLRQHFGSLLFFGLYNLMNSSKLVRSRALVFVRELLHMFSPDDAFDVSAYFSSFTGAFYSNVGTILKPKILAMSEQTSKMFSGDSGSFLWEAVRCSRSIQHRTVNSILMPPQRWVMELIQPWCHFANFTSLDDDVVNAEFFRFLTDIAFTNPKTGAALVSSATNEHQDLVNICWLEVAKSIETGPANTAILVDVIIQVAARFEHLRGVALSLMTALFTQHPQQISTALAYHLSSTAFPWRTDGGSPRRAQLRPIKDCIAVIEAANPSTDGESTSSDFMALCRSAVILSSELLRQNFETFIPHLPILINYILVNLPPSLQESSPAIMLLVGLVEGVVAWIHARDNSLSADYSTSLELIRKLMGWLEAREMLVTWDLISTGDESLTPKPSIPALEFIEMLLSIFKIANNKLRPEIAEEALYWSSEGYLSSDVTTRAISLYSFLITDLTIPVTILNPLTNRILDQLTVLAQLELDALAQTNKAGDNSKSAEPAWETLQKGKLAMKLESEKVIVGIMRVHKTLLNRHSRDDLLGENSELFWPVIGLLYLPPKHFSNLYIAVLDNLTYFVENAGTSINSDQFLAPWEHHLSGRFAGIQRLLVPALFCEDDFVQSKAFAFLFSAWQHLPTAMVDSNRTGPLYTIVFTTLWIFSQLYDTILDAGTFISHITSFKLYLGKHHASLFDDTHACLDVLRDALQTGKAVTADMRDEIFERCIVDLFSAFIPDFINNIAECLSQANKIPGPIGLVALRMTAHLWRIVEPRGFQNVESLRAMIRQMPFTNENRHEAHLLYRTVLLDKFEGMPIKDLDLVSQGKTEPVAVYEPITGTVKNATTWFSSELGIQVSNNVYSALLSHNNTTQ
eukprot:jgi/Hompol1/4705/HPOL_003827-RA